MEIHKSRPAAAAVPSLVPPLPCCSYCVSAKAVIALSLITRVTKLLFIWSRHSHMWYKVCWGGRAEGRIFLWSSGSMEHYWGGKYLRAKFNEL